jgi:hypothetical protein
VAEDNHLVFIRNGQRIQPEQLPRIPRVGPRMAWMTAPETSALCTKLQSDAQSLIALI